MNFRADENTTVGTIIVALIIASTCMCVFSFGMLWHICNKRKANARNIRNARTIVADITLALQPLVMTMEEINLHMPKKK
jgi:signal transduction histidine kinase